MEDEMFPSYQGFREGFLEKALTRRRERMNPFETDTCQNCSCGVPTTCTPNPNPRT